MGEIETDVCWNDRWVPSGLYDISCPWWGTIWVGECYVCFHFCGEDDENIYCNYPNLLGLKKSEIRVEDAENYDYGELPELKNRPTMYEYFQLFCATPRSTDEIRAKCCIGRHDFDRLVSSGCLCFHHSELDENNEKLFYIISNHLKGDQEDGP